MEGRFKMLTENRESLQTDNKNQIENTSEEIKSARMNLEQLKAVLQERAKENMELMNEHMRLKI
jgi:hypothetical protein